MTDDDTASDVDATPTDAADIEHDLPGVDLDTLPVSAIKTLVEARELPISVAIELGLGDMEEPEPADGPPDDLRETLAYSALRAGGLYDAYAAGLDYDEFIEDEYGVDVADFLDWDSTEGDWSANKRGLQSVIDHERPDPAVW